MHEPRLERALEAYLAFCDADPQPAWSEFLAEHAELRDLLEPMHEAAPTPHRPVEDGLRTLGDFTLLDELGRGGMGVVYRAEQRSVGRTVALKVLPAHLTLDAHAIARFQREATLAGRLDHPGIVEVYTVGSADGAQFFAMELIDGRSLAEVLATLRDGLRGTNRSLPTGAELHATVDPTATATGRKSGDSRSGSTATLHTFRDGYVETMAAIAAEVADALHHAHRHEVLHRDVKPSNIMLRRDGRVVLTDFGLAQEESLPSMTLTGNFLGTPHYVAPEQARGDRGSFGPTLDVFSLGATLYEMLTLRRPFDGPSTVEVLRRITDEEPLPPARWNRNLPADLSAIVMRALEKSPRRRYADAGELLDDLRAFLDKRPTRARPAGPLRRSIRWVQRNRLITASALAVFASLFAALVVSSLAQTRAEDAARTARDELTQREQAVDFLRWILSSPDPMVMGPDAPIGDLLERAGGEIAARFDAQPELRADMQALLGEIYASLGDDSTASRHLQRAFDWHRTHAPRSGRHAQTARELAASLVDDPARAASLLTEAVEILDDQFGSGGSQTISARCELARVLIAAGRSEEARAQVRVAEAGLAPESSPEARFDLLRTRARLKLHDARWPEALADYEAALAIPDLPQDGWAGFQRRTVIQSMLQTAARNGDTDRALAAAQQQIDYIEAELGPDHPELVVAYSNLATLRRMSGDHTGAEQPYLRSVELARANHEPPHAGLATSLSNLGALYRFQRRKDEALALLGEAVDMYVALYGEDHQSVAAALDNIADVHRDHGEHAAALPVQRRSLAILRAVHGDGHYETICSCFRTARLEVRCGELDAARADWRRGFSELPALTERQLDRAREFANDIDAALAELGPKTERVTFLIDLSRTLTGVERSTDAEIQLRSAWAIAAPDSRERIRAAAAEFREATDRPLELRDATMR